METSLILGLILVSLAGLGTGTVAWPIIRIKNFHFEAFLFTFMFTGIIFIPWSVLFLSVKEPIELFQSVGLKSIIISNLFSLCWGCSNILYLICVIRVGAAITGAILSAVGMTCGVLLPLVIKGTGLFKNSPNLFSPTGAVILSGLLILILGIILVSRAGYKRERKLQLERSIKQIKPTNNDFFKNLSLVVVAGILSSGISLAFVYSQDPIFEAVKMQRNGLTTANFIVWAIGMLGGGLVNCGYATYLLFKRKTWNSIFKVKSETSLGVLVGIQFILSIVTMGKGMLLLGTLGASVGFAIQQSTQILGNQLVGFAGGEWKGTNNSSRNLMYKAIFVILIAIVILAFSTTL